MYLSVHSLGVEAVQEFRELFWIVLDFSFGQRHLDLGFRQWTLLEKP